MRPVDRYIQDVMAGVFAAPADRERFEADLRSHFAEAEARGETPGRIIEDMGRPADVAASFNAERGIRYAGFWRRLVAFAGDLGLLMALALPLIAVGLLLPDGLGSPEPTAAGVITIALLGLAFGGVVLFYFPLLETRFGKTLGKHLLRIRVVRESGSPIGLGQAFVRRLSLYFEMLWIDALFIPFTEKRQRALDIIAKTVVAREPGEEAPWWSWAICLLLPAGALLCAFGLAFACAPS